MEPIGMILALDVAKREVLSARPDAPVVPEHRRRTRPGRADPAQRPSRSVRGAALASRHATAGVLRRLADRVEPCQPAAEAGC